MILNPGEFVVRDYRKAIPNKVKLVVLAREYEVDHDPALVNRPYDTEANDFVPAQNDPNFLVLRRREDHAEKTFGRKAGAEKTVTTRSSDVGEAKRTRDIKAAEAVHRAKLLLKAGDQSGADSVLASARFLKKHKRRKQKIPSRGFQKRAA